MFIPTVPRRITHALPALPSLLVPDKGITPPLNVSSVPQAPLRVPVCPDGGWLRGICKEHGTERWIKMRCKRRTCAVCGQERKERIAARVARGIEVLAGEDGAGWLVLTWNRYVNKKMAVDQVEQFVKWLNRYFRRVFSMVVEWAKVWERHKTGQLHLNIVMAPWRYITQAMLLKKWRIFGGSGVHIERVGAGIGVEAAKSRYKMGLYLAKYDQMVLSGRGVSYSKGFPKLPHEAHTPRRGEIDWQFVGNFSQEGIMHWYDTEMGNWEQLSIGEYCHADGEACDCFEFAFSPIRQAKFLRLAMERRNGGG